MRYFEICVLWAAAFALIHCQPAGDAGGEAEPSAPAVEEAPASMDPASVDPDHYTVDFENEYVRVTRGKFKAGDETPTHEHVAGVSVFLSAGSADVTAPGGEATESSWEAGDASWHDPSSHSAVVNSDIEYVTIDLKDEGGEPRELSEHDATKVDADNHVVEFENDRVRIVRMTYLAGKKSPEHVHLPGYNVMLTSSTAINYQGGEPVGEKTRLRRAPAVGPRAGRST